MTDERPAVEMLVLCESAAMRADGRPVLAGAFSRVGVPKFPCQMHPIVVALEIWGPPYRNVTLSMRLHRPGDFPPATMSDFDVEIERYGFVSFGAGIEGLPLPEPGLYALEILHDGEVLARRPFMVAQVDPDQARSSRSSGT